MGQFLTKTVWWTLGEKIATDLSMKRKLNFKKRSVIENLKMMKREVRKLRIQQRNEVVN